MVKVKGEKCVYMPENNVNWYVLFVKTGSEDDIVKQLKYYLGDACLPFLPKKVCVYRRNGKKSLFQKNCFPGYIFIESNKSSKEFILLTLPVIPRIKNAFRLLNNGDKTDIAMHDYERVALSKVLGIDHSIDISRGIKEGDSVRIISGSLDGNEGMITKINIGRHEAIIRLSMFGKTVDVSVGIEIIEKI